MNRPSLRWEGIKGEATKLRLHERSERDVLPLHEQHAKKGARLDLRVLYPFRSLKAVWFHAGCADIELAVEVFHQAFHKLGHRREPLLPCRPGRASLFPCIASGRHAFNTTPTRHAAHGTNLRTSSPAIFLKCL